MALRAFPRIESGRSVYLLFCVLLTALALGDATMGYAAPLLVERITNGSDTLMGVVLAASSVVGIVADYVFSRFFPTKGSLFFLRILFLFVFFFPIPFLLSTHLVAALIAMGMWGVYFEAMVFANMHAVDETVPTRDHAWAWGMNTILRTFAWIAGPMIASILYDPDRPLSPVRFSIFAYALGVIAFVILLMTAKKSHSHHKTALPQERSFATQLLLWRQYGRVLWPLLGFTIIYYLIESAFFSIGPLFAETLSAIHPLGGVFVSLSSLPGLFIGFLLPRLSLPFGKKRLSYLGGIIAGVGFLALGMSTDAGTILLTTFVGSVGLSLWLPSLSAVFQDFVGRAGNYGNDLIGLMAMAGSLAYILGPILNGHLSDRLGEQAVFAVWGIVALLYSSVLFFIVGRKVRLPTIKL